MNIFSGTKRPGSQFTAILAFFLFSAAQLTAQAPTRAHSIEVSGVFGASGNLPDFTQDLQAGLRAIGGSGFSVTQGSSFKWLAGGQVGYALSPQLLIVGEVSYNRIGNETINYRSGSTTNSIVEKFSLTDFGGGVHWQLPVSSRRYVPYIAAGIGAVRAGVSASGSGTPANLGGNTTDLSYNAGGGMRIYMSPSWGIRPEIRLVHIPGQIYYRYGVGVFWQSGK